MLGNRNLLIVLLSVILFLPIGSAFADHRWEDVYKRALEKKLSDLEIVKKGQEFEATQYQKFVLNFDYEKIQNNDPGFTEPVKSEVVKKKHIQNERVQNFVVVKNLNND
jgi:hypothetical protein